MRTSLTGGGRSGGRRRSRNGGERRRIPVLSQTQKLPGLSSNSAKTRIRPKTFQKTITA
jgi:hypothetical protein